jgi:hypothetical protein
MSESSESKVEKDEKLTKILSKVNTITKMMKTIHDDVDKIKNKMATKPEEQEKENIEKICQEHGLGRPSGDYTSKQKQYLDMLNKGKIKNPKNQTLELMKSEIHHLFCDEPI